MHFSRGRLPRISNHYGYSYWLVFQEIDTPCRSVYPSPLINPHGFNLFRNIKEGQASYQQADQRKASHGSFERCHTPDTLYVHWRVAFIWLMLTVGLILMGTGVLLWCGGIKSWHLYRGIVWMDFGFVLFTHISSRGIGIPQIFLRGFIAATLHGIGADLQALACDLIREIKHSSKNRGSPTRIP
jgi:hypothetical protein